MFYDGLTNSVIEAIQKLEFFLICFFLILKKTFLNLNSCTEFYLIENQFRSIYRVAWNHTSSMFEVSWEKAS